MFNLSVLNGYRIEAHAAAGVVAKSPAEVVEALQQNPSAIVIGSGHNIILAREKYDETFVVVSCCDESDSAARVEVRGKLITAYAGVSTEALSRVAAEAGLSGLEGFFDIPSALGGAIVMNAGTGERSIGDVLKSVVVFERSSGQLLRLTQQALEFNYRSSLLQQRHDLVVLEAQLQLTPGNRSRIWQEMIDIKRRRWEKQPRDLPSAGSVFRRPQGRFVGPMLDELGLRGFRVGGAEISRKHSGFIVNRGGATGRDVLELIDHVKSLVHDRFGVELVPEQVVI